MVFLILLLIIIGSFLIYLIYSSYFFQEKYNKNKNKKLILKLRNEIKGIFLGNCYFAPNHKIITKKEYNSYNYKEKQKFSFCYNSIIFKTEHCNWELFFNLIKSDKTYSQILNIRVFTKINHIKTEGNIEKNLSRLNIYTNSHYLSEILENEKLKKIFNFLVQNNNESININYNSIHFKSFKNITNEIDEFLEIIKTINQIKNKIYKKGILEY